MPAKIKTRAKRSHHHHPYRPKGVSRKAFKKVYWPYIPVVLIIGVLLSLGSSAGALSALVRHPGGSVLSYATSMSTSGLLASSNSARSQNGVLSLQLNSKLNAAAQAKANDMASRNYWSHNTPEGNPPWIFVTAQNYSYQKLGENLAAGFSDEQTAVNGWMSSAPHRANLLDSAFSHVGFGFANNANYTSAGGGPMTVVVAFYGKPQVLAAAAPKPAATSTPAPQRSSVPSVAQASESAKTPAAKKEPPKSDVPPPTTEEEITPELLTTNPSRAQIALVDSSMARFGTSLALIGLFAALGLWISRHILTLRRVFAHGEAFAIRHPLMDIGLLVIAALSFMLSQSAGLIQ